MFSNRDQLLLGCAHQDPSDYEKQPTANDQEADVPRSGIGYFSDVVKHQEMVVNDAFDQVE